LLSGIRLRNYFLELLELATLIEPLIADDKNDSFLYLFFYFFMLKKNLFQLMCYWFFFHLSLLKEIPLIYEENNFWTEIDFFLLFRDKITKTQKETISWSGHAPQHGNFVEHPKVRYAPGFPNSVASAGPWKDESPWGHFGSPLVAMHHVIFITKCMPTLNFAALRYPGTPTPSYHIFALNNDIELDRVTLITEFAQLDACNLITSVEFCPLLSEEPSADCSLFDTFLEIDISERRANCLYHNFLSTHLHSLDEKLYMSKTIGEFHLNNYDREFFSYGSNSAFDLHFTLELKDSWYPSN